MSGGKDRHGLVTKHSITVITVGMKTYVTLILLVWMQIHDKHDYMIIIVLNLKGYFFMLQSCTSHLRATPAPHILFTQRKIVSEHNPGGDYIVQHNVVMKTD